MSGGVRVQCCDHHKGDILISAPMTKPFETPRIKNEFVENILKSFAGNLENVNFVANSKVKLIFIQQPNNSLECSVLRIIIPNEYNGSIQTKTIPVRPHTTTKDVIRIIAHKSQITNAMDYGLFKLIEGEGKYLIKELPLPIVRRKSPLRLMIYLFRFFTLLLSNLLSI